VRARAIVGAWDVDGETPTQSSGEVPRTPANGVRMCMVRRQASRRRAGTARAGAQRRVRGVAAGAARTSESVWGVRASTEVRGEQH
jgi:hypothetical protein